VVATPPAFPARSGDLVTSVAVPASGWRHAVVFEWVDGVPPEPAEAAGLTRAFRALGEVTARLHCHARTWRRPPGFARFDWTWHTTLGRSGRWGGWADGLHSALPGPAGARGAALLGQAVAEIERRLAEYGCGADRFGLVHADLRLANLLVAGDPARPGDVHVIDFDDCGFSWYLYDLAASLSFIEHSPAAGELVEAWLAGYRGIAPLAAADEMMIPTFVMMRRVLLVAWLGTHPHSAAVGSVADYAAASCALADDYLAGRFLVS
jgi:Ser/Thr protein kinase RdoA (MazF antagonist)